MYSNIFIFLIKLYMPYHIRKIKNKNLYKVYDNKGHSTTKNGMTKTNALKQIIAIKIKTKNKH